MHLKSKKFVNKNGETVEYFQLVKSYRTTEGKNKHRVVVSLGRKDSPAFQEKITKLALKLSELAGIDGIINPKEDISTLWSKVVGPNLVFRKLWNDLRFNAIFDGNYHEHIFLMVMNRLCDPRSKLSCMKWKEGVYEPLWDDIQLHDLYKSLDWLEKNKTKLEVQIFKKIKNLFNQGIDLVLFDTTSVSYWGEGDCAPDLLKRGHAKNKRNDLKQLMIGLFMTKEGIPVGHEVFPGNQVDVVSFPQVITKLKNNFNLNKVIWVCDRGMISQSNLDLLDTLKQEYIIGVKMRQLDCALRHLLLGNVNDHLIKKISHNLFVKEVFASNRRYIVCFNPEQAIIDANNRERFKEIIIKKVLEKSDKSWIMKNGYKKYLNLKEDIIESIDYERLEKEKIYDGKWILLTNTKSEYTEVARHYKSLWQIEHAFKELKSSLDVSPMYHWKEQRIKGHIFVCFLALALELGLTRLLKNCSYSEVMEDLKRLQATLVRIKDRQYLRRSEFINKADLGFRAVQLQIPGIDLA